jgi:hypothetical protein
VILIMCAFEMQGTFSETFEMEILPENCVASTIYRITDVNLTPMALLGIKS